MAQITASLQHPSFGMKPASQRPPALTTELRADDLLSRDRVSRLLSGNLSTGSHSGGLLSSGNIFDNCSPGSLIGSLKPFAADKPATSTSLSTHASVKLGDTH